MNSPCDLNDSNEGCISDASTPSPSHRPVEIFQPKFIVKVTEPIKDGEIITYNVKSTPTDGGKEYNVIRQYADFEFLHHCLITGDSTIGIIIPPLAAKPVLDPKDANSKSKRQLGSQSKTLMGDDFDRDCRSLETYLRHLVAHPVLGTSRALLIFLTIKQAPERVKIKKGLFGKISSLVVEARKANHRDIDDFFQKERDWAADHARNLKELSENFNKVVYSEQRLSVAYAHLSTTLNLGGGCDDFSQSNKVLVRFSEAIEDAKHGCDVAVINDENTLGFNLDLAARFAESLKEMLFQRTCLMVNYEECNRALDKVKPNRRTEAEENKLTSERALDECSEVARREIQHYKHSRVLSLQRTLLLYAEAKIKTSRDSYALLAKSLLHFQQMEL